MYVDVADLQSQPVIMFAGLGLPSTAGVQIWTNLLYLRPRRPRRQHSCRHSQPERGRDKDLRNSVSTVFSSTLPHGRANLVQYPGAERATTTTPPGGGGRACSSSPLDRRASHSTYKSWYALVIELEGILRIRQSHVFYLPPPGTEIRTAVFCQLKREQNRYHLSYRHGLGFELAPSKSGNARLSPQRHRACLLPMTG